MGIFVGASDVHVHGDGAKVQGFTHGISLERAHANLLDGLIVTGNCIGIRLFGDVATGRGSNGNHIKDNNIFGNFQQGVSLQHGSNGNKFEGNVVNANGLTSPEGGAGGIRVADSDGNVIVFNAISGNRDYGVVLAKDTTVTGSNHNTIHSNLVKDTTSGQGIRVVQGNNNAILGNTAVENGAGIAINAGSGENFIQNNIAVANTVDLVDGNANCGSNIWENNIFEKDSEDNGPDMGCIQ
jgi:parallel beta-helix repeat protein